jgi:hypothetical protein
VVFGWCSCPQRFPIVSLRAFIVLNGGFEHHFDNYAFLSFSTLGLWIESTRDYPLLFRAHL